MERYKIIKKLDFSEQYISCPVELSNGAVLYDEKEKSLALQLKMRFLTSKEIRSIDVQVTYEGKENTKNVTFTYNEIEKAEKGRFFGKNNAILLGSNKADNIKVLVTSILYGDGMTWEYNGEPPVYPCKQMELKICLSHKLLLQYYEREDKKDFVKLRTKLPVQNDDNWQCACGKINRNIDVSCNRCTINKYWIFKHTDKEYLENSLRVYEDNQRKIREEAAEKAEAERQFIIRLVKIVALIIVAIFFFRWFFGYVNIIWSHSVYKKAEKYMEEKQYAMMLEECYRVAPVPLERTEESKSVEINVMTLLENCSSNILNDYAIGSISDNDAKTYLTIISKYISDTEILSSYKEIEKSKNSYSSGLRSMKNKDYLIAIEKFNLVLKNDVNYSLATQKIEECKNLLKPDTIAKLAKYEESGNFEEGLELITKVSKYLKKDVDIEGYRDRFKYKIEYAKLDEKGKNAMSNGIGVSYGTQLHNQPHRDHKSGYETTAWGKTRILAYRITQEDDILILWCQVRSNDGIYWVIDKIGYLQ